MIIQDSGKWKSIEISVIFFSGILKHHWIVRILVNKWGIDGSSSIKSNKFHCKTSSSWKRSLIGLAEAKFFFVSNLNFFFWKCGNHSKLMQKCPRRKSHLFSPIYKCNDLPVYCDLRIRFKSLCKKWHIYRLDSTHRSVFSSIHLSIHGKTLQKWIKLCNNLEPKSNRTKCMCWQNMCLVFINSKCSFYFYILYLLFSI